MSMSLHPSNSWLLATAECPPGGHAGVSWGLCRHWAAQSQHRRNSSTWPKRWPLSPCAERQSQAACCGHTIASGPAWFLSGPDRMLRTPQPDSPATVRPPSGTQDSLCLRVSNAAFTTGKRKIPPPKKTFFNRWRLMAMKSSLLKNLHSFHSVSSTLKELGYRWWVSQHWLYKELHVLCLASEIP